MRTILRTVLLIVFSIALMETAHAQSSFTQNVTVVVAEINAIAASANAVTLTINSAVAGSAPTDATDNSTFYKVTTNATNKKITAALGSAFSDGIQLSVSLAAPTGATSVGTVQLTTTDQDLVTGISQLAESNLTISYTASALATTDANGAGETQVVTYTLTAGV